VVLLSSLLVSKTMSQERKWALILGASSGFGEAAAIALAKAGRNIFGVHLDRRGTLPNVERILEAVAKEGAKAKFFNVNAADAEKRAETVSAMTRLLEEEGSPAGRIDLLLHSLAFGTLKPYLAGTAADRISPAQMGMTLEVMANSLVYWTQDLVAGGLLGDGAHVFAMTSAGGHRIWPSYGAVSAAKAALESNCRQLAVELIPRRIAVNAIRAGVTDTPALRKIPGNELMIEKSLSSHPAGRLTVPGDVAAVLVALARPETIWMTGNVLGVDGTEDLVG
jgi:NAD(P)-dependent dehydrogenase (short-subunit alcohol dehydrogenase family)